jgi:hypothetical protein
MPASLPGPYTCADHTRDDDELSTPRPELVVLWKHGTFPRGWTWKGHSEAIGDRGEELRPRIRSIGSAS